MYRGNKMAGKNKVETITDNLGKTKTQRIEIGLAIMTGLAGIIIGIFLGYYLLPHINYSITTQPGTYVFDVGPNAANYLGNNAKTYLVESETERGSMPIPNTIYSGNWSGPASNISTGCCYPLECYESMEAYINQSCNRDCEYPVACTRIVLE